MLSNNVMSVISQIKRLNMVQSNPIIYLQGFQFNIRISKHNNNNNNNNNNKVLLAFVEEVQIWAKCGLIIMGPMAGAQITRLRQGRPI